MLWLPQNYLGRALALRSLFGVGAGAVAPLAFGAVLDWLGSPAITTAAWGWAFASLGIAGIGAAVCAYGLRRDEPCRLQPGGAAGR